MGRRLLVLFVAAAVAAFGFTSCDDGAGDGDGDTDVDADSDTDTDTDTDADGDADSDAGGDADGDADSDADGDGDADGDTDGDADGALVVDPSNRRWLFHDDGRPFFLCAPGDPEDFLYRGERQTDGTRVGDQGAILDRLGPTGANGLYFQAVRSHGGDGGGDHNPFEGSDPEAGLDEDILGQWEGWLDAMDAHGIVPFFFIYDDSACIWGCSRGSDHAVPDEERLFLEALVDRFEHHPRLVWVIAEEYSEAFSSERVSNMAAVIRGADDADHPIAVHKLSGISFDELAADPNIDQFAIQLGELAPDPLHAQLVEAFSRAGGDYGLNMSEIANHGAGAVARRRNWASAMGGAYVMVIGWDVITTDLGDLEGCGHMVSFMESTRFDTMSPQDSLALGDTDYVLGSPADRFILYGYDGVATLGVGAVAPGTYDLTWMDVTTGHLEEQPSVDVAGGDTSWAAPGGLGNDVVLYVRRSGA